MNKPDSKKGRIELTDLVAALRRDIEVAQERLQAEGKEAMFKLSQVEAEVQFVAEEDRTASGRVNIYVVNLGGESKLRASTTHRLKVTLVPKPPEVDFAG